MAVSYVGVSNGNSGSATSTSFVTTLPAGWQADDVAVIIGHVRGTSLTMTMSAGWLALPGTWPYDQSTNSRIYGWYRVLQAGDTAPTITNSGSMTGGWEMTVYRGADTTTPIVKVGTSGISSTSLTMPSLTGVGAGSAIAAHVHAGVASGTIPTNITYNAVYTEVVDAATSRTTTAANIRMAAGYRLISSAGNYGGEAVTSTITSSMIAVLIEIDQLVVAPSNVTLTPATATSSAPAVSPVSGATSVTLTTVVATTSAPAVSPAVGASAVTLTPAVATSSAAAITATPNVTLTPVTQTITAIPLTVATGTSSVTLTPATATITAPAVSPASGATSVTLTPKAITTTAAPITATVNVALTPKSVTTTAVPISAASGATSVTLTPASATTSAPAVSAASGAVNVTLTPAVVASTAVVVAPTAGPVTVTLSPAVLALAPIALGVGGVSVVGLSAATMSITSQALTLSSGVVLGQATATVTAVPVTAAPGPTSVTLTSAVMTGTARPLTLSSAVILSSATTTTTAVPLTVATGPISITLTPTVMTITVFPLGVGGVSVVALSPAQLITTALPLTTAVGPTSVALTPASLSTTARAITAVSGPININIIPAQATITLGSLSLISLRIVDLTPARFTIMPITPVVGALTPGVDLMTIAFVTVTGVGEYIRGELADTEGGVPQRFSLIVPGAIAWDNCECGLFAQSITSVVSSRAFPTPATDIPNDPCGHPQAVVSVTMSLLRCVPNIDDRGAMPSVEALLEAARILEDDRLALRRGVAAYLRQLCQTYKITNYTVGAAQSVGPEGLCGGIELTYSFGITNDAVTCG